ncbi:tetratricopeptide repeat-containing sensor histidine kinase [Lunatimonas lonarensis]|nr:tetratricopeptide repeat protein [Lunatimonas lonarensis]
MQAFTLAAMEAKCDSINYWFEETERLWAAREFESCKQAAKNYFQCANQDTKPEKAALIARRASRSALNLGRFEEALRNALLGLQWAEKSKDPNLLAFQYADIAVIYHDFEEFENGTRYGKEGLFKAQASDADTRHQAYILNSIAINFDDWGKPDSALHYHYKVLKLNPLPDSLDIQFTFNNIGNTLLKTHRLKEAEPFLWTSIRLAKKQDNYYNQSSSFTNLGQVYQQLGKHEDASRFFDSALVYAKLANSIEKLRDTYLDRSNFHKALGQYELALENQGMYQQLRDSIYQIDRLRMFSELEAQYQGKIKDQQIMEQEQEIIIQKANFNKIVLISSILLLTIIFLTIIHFLNQNRFKKQQLLLQKEKEIEIKEAYIHAALESQESERKRFAQDLHDGFGQLISALRLNISRLQHSSGQLESRMEVVEKSEGILAEMHKEIRNIAFNLMPATLIQFGLKEGIREFAQRLNQSGKISIEVSVFGMEERFGELQEISLYRVVQEWVNNTIKYASPQKISIQLTRHEDELSLIIEDDGKGFDPSILENASGNGWRNIQSRLQRINARWEVDSTIGRRGTTFIVDIPIKEFETEAGHRFLSTTGRP